MSRRTRIRSAIHQRQYGRCIWCNRHVPFEESTLDHLIPKAMGGTSRQENLAMSCGPCNRRKGSLVPSGVFELAPKDEVDRARVRAKARLEAIRRSMSLTTDSLALRALEKHFAAIVSGLDTDAAIEELRGVKKAKRRLMRLVAQENREARRKREVERHRRKYGNPTAGPL